ncbi:hypothetical protein [Streptomyces sp. enrichment culture]|uniref:hypothetical protein n=1 Tax=Streptomyces sp. enrichment culture TaxID=1795815 RepID=UPI003F5733BF
MCDGFPESASRVLGTRRGILVEIFAATLDDLIQGVFESNEPGDPEVVDNLWLSVSMARDESTSDIPRHIRVEIDPHGLTLSIAGDPAWARAKVDHLKALIEDTQGKQRFWSFSPQLTGVIFAGFTWGVCVLASILGGVDLSGRSGIPLWFFIPLAVCPAFSYFAGNVIGFRVEQRHATTIWISASAPPPQAARMTRFEKVTVAISIASLLAAIIFGYLGYDKDKQEPEKKDKAFSSSLLTKHDLLVGSAGIKP